MTADERTRELNDQQRDDELPSLWQYKCEWCWCDTEGGSDHRECECCRDLPALKYMACTPENVIDCLQAIVRVANGEDRR